MIPPVIDPGTRSNAERKLFSIISSELSDEWIVLHSLNLKDHGTQPWTEIDFVLIGPPGVFCIEVKGGRVRRVAGEWQFIDGNDRVTRNPRGPFEQVQSATQALNRYIKTDRPHLEEVAVVSGVAVPDSTIEGDGPDIVTEIIYDADSSHRPFEQYLAEVMAYWRDVFATRFSFIPRPLPSHTREEIFALLRGDFDVRTMLRPLIHQVKSEVMRFTEDQARVLAGLELNDRIIVEGSAGTGKTMLAVEEARKWSEAGKKVFLTCFNRNLARHLKHATSGTGIHATSLHSFMVEIVRESGFVPPPRPADYLMKTFYPKMCARVLTEAATPRPFDVLIIDEGQDLLLPAYVHVFDALLRKGVSQGFWRIFLDHQQDLFSGVHRGVLDKLLSHSARFRLYSNCRNSRRIAVATSAISGTELLPTIDLLGAEVEVNFVGGPHDERLRVSRTVAQLLEKRINPQDIVILGPRRLENSSLLEGLVNVMVPLKPLEHPFEDNVIRYATIRSFKGLEADAVILIGMDNFRSKSALNELYVGLSRARAYLALFVNRNARSEYYQRFGEFGQRLIESDGKTIPAVRP